MKRERKKRNGNELERTGWKGKKGVKKGKGKEGEREGRGRKRIEERERMG